MTKTEKRIVRAAMRDRVRMSFIEKHGMGIVRNEDFVHPRMSLRVAIDRAMKRYAIETAAHAKRRKK